MNWVGDVNLAHSLTLSFTRSHTYLHTLTHSHTLKFSITLFYTLLHSFPHLFTFSPRSISVNTIKQIDGYSLCCEWQMDLAFSDFSLSFSLSLPHSLKVTQSEPATLNLQVLTSLTYHLFSCHCSSWERIKGSLTSPIHSWWKLFIYVSFVNFHWIYIFHYFNI